MSAEILAKMQKMRAFSQDNPLSYLLGDLFIAQRLHSEGSAAGCGASNFAGISKHLRQRHPGVNYAHISVDPTIRDYAPFSQQTALDCPDKLLTFYQAHYNHFRFFVQVRPGGRYLL